MTASEEIGRAFAAIQAEQAVAEAQERYRRAQQIMRTIPSGTADADLTPEQAQAVDDYEAAIEELRWLESEEENR